MTTEREIKRDRDRSGFMYQCSKRFTHHANGTVHRIWFSAITSLYPLRSITNYRFILDLMVWIHSCTTFACLLSYSICRAVTVAADAAAGTIAAVVVVDILDVVVAVIVVVHIDTTIAVYDIMFSVWLLLMCVLLADECYWTKQVFHPQYFYFVWVKEFQTFLHSIVLMHMHLYRHLYGVRCVLST